MSGSRVEKRALPTSGQLALGSQIWHEHLQIGCREVVLVAIGCQLGVAGKEAVHFILRKGISG